MEHFTEEELKEIEGTTIPEIPDLSDEIDDFLGKFLGKVINILITHYYICCNKSPRSFLFYCRQT